MRQFVRKGTSIPIDFLSIVLKKVSNIGPRWFLRRATMGSNKLDILNLANFVEVLCQRANSH